jgi:hypothetical protein
LKLNQNGIHSDRMMAFKAEINQQVPLVVKCLVLFYVEINKNYRYAAPLLHPSPVTCLPAFVLTIHWTRLSTKHNHQALSFPIHRWSLIGAISVCIALPRVWVGPVSLSLRHWFGAGTFTSSKVDIMHLNTIDHPAPQSPVTVTTIDGIGLDSTTIAPPVVDG